MSVGECQNVAHPTTQTLSKIRLDDAFSKFWETNLREAKRLEIENPVLLREKQRIIRYAIRNAPAKFSGVETNYRQIYFEVLDIVISGITSRFNQKNYSKYYAKMESLHLSTANNNEFQQDLFHVCNFYGDDFKRCRLDTQLKL